MNHLRFLLAALAIPSILNLPPPFAGCNADNASSRTLHWQFLSSPPPPISVPIPKPLFNHSPPPPSPLTHSLPMLSPAVVPPANLALPNEPNIPKSHKTEIIAILASVSLVIFIMMLVSAFFLYRSWNKHAARPANLFDSDSQREQLVAVAMDASPSSFHLGAVESRASKSPNSIHMLESQLPSPELSPLPPLTVHFQRPAPPLSSSDVETETSFYSVEDATNETRQVLRASQRQFPASTAPVQNSSSPTQFQGVSLKTQFSDSSSNQQAVAPPQEAQHQPSNWQEKDDIPHWPPPELVLPPSANDPATRAESSGHPPQTPDGESGDPGSSETWVPPARDGRLCRPPSLTLWNETQALVVEDDVDEILEEPLDLVDDKEDRNDNLSSSH